MKKVITLMAILGLVFVTPSFAVSPGNAHSNQTGNGHANHQGLGLGHHNTPTPPTQPPVPRPPKVKKVKNITNNTNRNNNSNVNRNNNTNTNTNRNVVNSTNTNRNVNNNTANASVRNSGNSSSTSSIKNSGNSTVNNSNRQAQGQLQGQQQSADASNSGVNVDASDNSVYEEADIPPMVAPVFGQRGQNGFTFSTPFGGAGYQRDTKDSKLLDTGVFIQQSRDAKLIDDDDARKATLSIANKLLKRSCGKKCMIETEEEDTKEETTSKPITTNNFANK